MSNYHPDAWVIIKITNNGVMYYKVLAGWYGGYANGDSWKINSGITKVDKVDGVYEFSGYSGSSYFCHQSVERLTGLTAGVLSSLQKDIETIGASIEVVPVSEVIEYFK
jgi:hypothetical protein